MKQLMMILTLLMIGCSSNSNPASSTEETTNYTSSYSTVLLKLQKTMQQHIIFLVEIKFLLQRPALVAPLGTYPVTSDLSVRSLAAPRLLS